MSLRTFRDYLEARATLAVWCPGCKRTAACNTAALVAGGMGERVVQDSRPRCRICGSLGQWRNVPRVPTRAGPDNVIPFRPR